MAHVRRSAIFVTLIAVIFAVEAVFIAEYINYSRIGSDVYGAVLLVAGCFISGIKDIPSRVASNLINPFAIVWHQFALMPAGAGAFSLGGGGSEGAPFMTALRLELLKIAGYVSLRRRAL